MRATAISLFFEHLGEHISQMHSHSQMVQKTNLEYICRKSDGLSLSHRETGRHDEEDNAIDDDSTVDSLVR